MSSIRNLKVLFYISKYLGLNPCTISRDGILEFSTPSFILSTGFVASVSLFLFWRAFFHWNKSVHTPVLDTAIKFESVAFAFTYAVSMGNALIKCKEVAKTLRRISSVDYIIGPMFLEKTRSYFTYTCSLKLALGFISAACAFTSLKMQYDVINFLTYFPIYIILYCSPYVVLTQFSCLAHLCCCYFGIINKQIINLNTRTLYGKSQGQENSTQSNIKISTDILEVNCLLRDNTRDMMDNCRSLAVIHGKLCDLLTLINSVYSLPILLNIANIFVTITVSMFCAFLIICEYSKETTLGYVLVAYCAWCVLKLTIVFHACIACTSEVSVQILSIFFPYPFLRQTQKISFYA